MKVTYVVIGLFLVAAVTFVIYSLDGGQSPEDYAKEILHEREEKDLMMKTGKDSPFVGSTESFKELKYFVPDIAYRISARLVPVEDKKMVVLPTSDQLQKKYLEYAYAEFELNGIANKLLIMEIVDDGPYRGTLFLAFADETSAGETYGAGRYLDLKKVPGSTRIVLDFNKAYNPYCAYSDKYSCPFPPPENVMKVAIRAGEKVYHVSER